jgi:hypothetical protein
MCDDDDDDDDADADAGGGGGVACLMIFGSLGVNGSKDVGTPNVCTTWKIFKSKSTCVNG